MPIIIITVVLPRNKRRITLLYLRRKYANNAEKNLLK